MILEASTPSEIDSVFATIVRERLGALVVSGENFFLSRRDRLVELAAQHRVSTLREFVTAGGLMSYRKRYGWCLSHSWRKKPTDLPAEQATENRDGRQSENREGAWPHDPPAIAWPRRRGDRMRGYLAAIAHSRLSKRTSLGHSLPLAGVLHCARALA